MRLSFLLVFLSAIPLAPVSAQLEITLSVDSARLEISCVNPIGGPDPLYIVDVAGEGAVTYAPQDDPCFATTPNDQYTVNYPGSCDAPNTVEICLEIMENVSPIGCSTFPLCSEQDCFNIPLPRAGRTRLDSLVLSGGDAEGTVYLSLRANVPTGDNNFICEAVDLGLLDYGVTLGDSLAGVYDNNCADAEDEINPTDINVNLFNNHGVWFKYRTGAQVSPLQIVQVINDPNNSGDFIDAEIMVFSTEDCTGELARYPLYQADYSGRDAEIRLFCPLPETDYYILVDGAGNDESQQGVFGISVFDPGLPGGADLKCDATDLGVIPDNGRSDAPTPVGNFCAGFAGDPFVRNFISRNSVWFTFRAPASGHVRVDAAPLSVDLIDIELALYESRLDTCDSFLTHLYSGRDAASFAESFTTSCLDPGRQYWILVDGSGQQSQGFFELSVTDLGDIRPVTNQTATICAGDAFPVGDDIEHTSSGVFTDTLKIPGTNCDSIVITDLTVLPPLELAVEQIRPAVGANGTDGAARAVVSGGAGGLTVSWCGGPPEAATTDTVRFNALRADAECCVTLTDAFGCSRDTCFTVDWVEPFVPFSSAKSPPCRGDSTGTLSFGINGGRAPYAYSWFNADESLGGVGVFTKAGDSLRVDDLPSGDFTVRIRGTFFDSTFLLQLSDPAQLELTVDRTEISCFGACDGDFLVDATGGTGAYTFDTTTPNEGLGCAGTYAFLVTDANGCVARVVDSLVEPKEFIVSAVTSPVSCKDGSDGSVVLVTNGTPQSFNWDHGPTVPTLMDLSAGSYRVEVTDADGCTDTLTVSVDEPAEPLTAGIEVARDITCATDRDGELRALVTGGAGGVSYAWSDGQSDRLATGLGPGDYGLRIVDERGCVDSSRFTLSSPPPLTARVESRDLRCPDPENAGEISVPEVDGGVGPYLFSLNDLNFRDSPLFTGLTAGGYVVVVQDALGCEFRQPASINPPPELTVTLGEDRDVHLGDSILLTATANSDDLRFDWSVPGAPATGEWFYRPTESGRVRLTVTDTLTECVTEASVYFMVDESPRFYVPTAFSPNGDGVNDVFFPFGGADVVSVSDFRIFNRSGGQMYQYTDAFSPNSPGSGWNGLINGELAPVGMYVYRARVRFFDGREEVLAGEVMLLR